MVDKSNFGLSKKHGHDEYEEEEEEAGRLRYNETLTTAYNDNYMVLGLRAQ